MGIGSTVGKLLLKSLFKTATGGPVRKAIIAGGLTYGFHEADEALTGGAVTNKLWDLAGDKVAAPIKDYIKDKIGLELPDMPDMESVETFLTAHWGKMAAGLFITGLVAGEGLTRTLAWLATAAVVTYAAWKGELGNAFADVKGSLFGKDHETNAVPTSFTVPKISQPSTTQGQTYSENRNEFIKNANGALVEINPVAPQRQNNAALDMALSWDNN